MTDIARPRDRFGTRIERPDHADFPFYDGRPAVVTGRRWGIVIGAVVVGYLALILLGGPLDGPFTGFVPPVLFAGIPLAALIWATPTGWTALFRRVTGRDVTAMVGFAALNIAVTLVLGLVVAATTGASANPQADVLENAPPLDVAMFYPHTLVQLFGEELLTILPFLALLQLLTHRWRLSRRRAVIWAWIITAVMFGLLHLPTYDWNVVQSVLVIGGARMVLTLAYIRTKNLWVSTGAHVVNDWILFTVPLALSALAG